MQKRRGKFLFCCNPCPACLAVLAENLLKGSIATEVESRQSWSDRERERPRDSVVQFPDAVDSDKDSDEDVSIYRQ